MWVTPFAYRLPHVCERWRKYTCCLCRYWCFFPFASRKAWVSAISSALWAVVPLGKLLAQIVCFSLTTAAPAFRFPSTKKLLPSVYQLGQPGHGWSVRSFLVLVSFTRMSIHWCAGRELLAFGSKVAGFRTAGGVNCTLSVSNRLW